MNVRELIALGAADLGLKVSILGDGPSDTRKARSPHPKVPAVYADIIGDPKDVRRAYDRGSEMYMNMIFDDRD